MGRSGHLGRELRRSRPARTAGRARARPGRSRPRASSGTRRCSATAAVAGGRPPPPPPRRRRRRSSAVMIRQRDPNPPAASTDSPTPSIGEPNGHSTRSTSASKPRSSPTSGNRSIRTRIRSGSKAVRPFAERFLAEARDGILEPGRDPAEDLHLRRDDPQVRLVGVGRRVAERDGDGLPVADHLEAEQGRAAPDRLRAGPELRLVVAIRVELRDGEQIDDLLERVGRQPRSRTARFSTFSQMIRPSSRTVVPGVGPQASLQVVSRTTSPIGAGSGVPVGAGVAGTVGTGVGGRRRRAWCGPARRWRGTRGRARGSECHRDQERGDSRDAHPPVSTTHRAA